MIETPKAQLGMLYLLHSILLFLRCTMYRRSIAGTILVKDINPGVQPSFPNYLTAFGERVVFRAYDPLVFTELWISDGTGLGTTLLKDINVGGSSVPSNLTATENFVFFEADDGVNGSELWRTDGTLEGTTLLSDTVPGAEGSSPQEFFNKGKRLYLSASTPETGAEPYVMKLP